MFHLDITAVPENATSTEKSSADSSLLYQLCRTTFSTISKVEEHARLHGADVLDLNSVPALTDSTPKSRHAVCTVCQKSYFTKYHLRDHIKNCHADVDVDLVCRIRTRASEPVVTCPVCMMKFFSKYQLRKHIRRAHSEADTDVLSLLKTASVTCSVCSMIFTQKGASSSLRKHVRTVHGTRTNGGDAMKIKRNRAIFCPLCSLAGKHVHALRKHIKEAHPEQAMEDLCTFTFSNEEEFFVWKRDEESRTRSMFVKNRNEKLHGGLAQRYYCHRSGAFVPLANRKRRLKTRGSCKIGATCPAFMKAVYSDGGIVTVTYSPSHVGHDMEPTRLALDKQERERIAELLSSNHSLDDVLEKLRENVWLAKLSRLHGRLGRQDLISIAREFGLSISCERSETNCVLEVGAMSSVMEVGANVDESAENGFSCRAGREIVGEEIVADDVGDNGAEVAPNDAQVALSGAEVAPVVSETTDEHIHPYHQGVLLPVSASMSNGIIFNTIQSSNACYVCGDDDEGDDEAVLNELVDSCNSLIQIVSTLRSPLNRTAVREITREIRTAVENVSQLSNVSR